MENSQVAQQPRASHRRLTIEQNPISHKRRCRTTLIVAAFVWMAALLLYISTAGPGIIELFDDSLEFQVVAPTFGIAHPTGYPLYTILGGIWSRALLPAGSWAWRMNVFSALAGASAVLFIYLIAAGLAIPENGPPDPWAGLSAALVIGSGPLWWGQTTYAEVYALHGLFLATILYVAISIPPLVSKSATDGSLRCAIRRMVLLCLLVGLSLAHHRTTLLLLPGLAFYLLLTAPSLLRPRREWLLWICALVLPLGLYLWIPIRSEQGVADLNGSYVNTAAGFFDHVLARGYTGFFSENTLGVPHSALDALDELASQQGAVASVIAVVGLLSMPVRGKSVRARWALLVLVLAVNLVFVVRYQVPDWEIFLIPVLIALSLFVGAGVSIASLVSARALRRRHMVFLTGAAITIGVLAGILSRGEYINRSDDWEEDAYTHLIGTVDFPPNSCFIGLEGETTALKYLQASEGTAKDALPITADDPEARAVQIARCVGAGRPTYITRELPGIESQYSFSGEGPLVRVWERGEAVTNPARDALGLELLDGRLRLEGYTTRALELQGGPILEVTLDWFAAEQLETDVKVSLRLLDSHGNVVLDRSEAPISQDLFPLRHVAPSSTWLPGERMHDVYHLALRGVEDASRLLVIVYDSETVAELGRVELPVH